MPTFTEPFTTSLSLTWTIVRGTVALTVSGGAGIINSATNGNVRAESDVGSADMFAELDVAGLDASTDRTVFVLARCNAVTGTNLTTQQTYYALSINAGKTASGAAGPGTWALLKYVSGTATPIVADTYIAVPATPFKLRIETQGSTIRAYIGGTLMGTYTDTGITSGQRGGIGFFNGSTIAKVDNFSTGPLLIEKSGSATATMKLNATGTTGAKRASGSPAAGALRLTAGTTGAKNAADTPSATLRLAASTAGAKSAADTPSATLRLAASMLGMRINAVTATMRLTASAAGTRTSASAASAPLRLAASETATGTRNPNAATATLRLAATTTASRNTPGTPSATMRLAASFTGAKQGLGSLTATLRLAASLTGTKNVPGPRTATLRLTAALSGVTRDGGSTATATLRLLASSTASSDRANTVSATALRLLATSVGTHIISEVSSAALTARAQVTVPYELVCVARIPQTSGPPSLLQVDPIDWTGMSYTDELSKPQTLTVGSKITSLTEPVLQRLRNPAELATELWLYRNGKLIFAGPLMGWQVQGEALTFQAQGLLAYLKMMIVASDQTFKQVDQFAIGAKLVDQWQALDYGNFGIDTSTVGTSGVLRDATYLAKELHNVQQRVFEIGMRDNGFDIEIDPSSRKLQLYYPLKGVDRSTGEDSIVFDARNVTSPNIVCSVAPGDVASEAYATGTGTATLFSLQSNLVRRAQYGRTAVAATFDGVSVQSTLDAHTLGFLDVRDEALLIPGPDTRVTPDADLSAYDVGDTVSYQLHSQLDIGGAFRLRKRSVKVSKTGQETVSVAFA